MTGKTRSRVAALAASVFSSPSSTLDDRVRRFNEWYLPKIPAHGNAMEVFVTDDRRLGARATRDIAVNDPYSTAPAALVIGRNDLRTSPLRWLFEKMPDEFTAMLLFVVHERRLGADSQWAPYLDILPRSYKHHPFTFDDNEIAELQASGLSRFAFFHTSHDKNFQKHAIVFSLSAVDQSHALLK